MSAFPARRILIPMDLSPLSAHARAWAKTFSGPDTALEALFAYDMIPAPLFGFPGPPLSARSRRLLLSGLARACPGAEHRVVDGDPATAITRQAKRADLVVMAAHARHGFGRFLLGSVSETVVRDCPAPVLVVKGAPRRVRSVLAPVNDAFYARKGFALAAETAAYLGAELVLLYVAAKKARGPNPRFFLNPLVAGLSEGLRQAVRPRILLRAGEPVAEILQESRRHGLIVLTAHRKPLLKDLVLGTTAERVLRHASAAVLTAPSV